MFGPIGNEKYKEYAASIHSSAVLLTDLINRVLDAAKYELDEPKYDVDECIQRGMTYSAPLRVTLRLVVWDIDGSPLKNVKATPHNCVCESQPSFCSTSAVPKMGNTYSIPPFSEL